MGVSPSVVYTLRLLYDNEDVRLVINIILTYCLILFLSFVLWSDKMQILFVTFLTPIVTFISLTWKQNMPMDKMKMVIKFFKVGLFQCSLTSLIIEGILTIILCLMCFSDQMKDIISSIEANKDSMNPLMNIHIQKTFGFYTYIFVTSFLSAGFVEESTKLVYLLNSFKEVYREKDFFKNDIAYTLVLCSTCLSMGYSTLETILYLVSQSSFSFEDALLRCLMSMPFHVCCGILSSLRWLSSSWECMTVTDIMNILMPSVILHGLYDYITHMLHPFLILDVDEWNLYSFAAIFIYALIFTTIFYLMIKEWRSLQQQYHFQQIKQ